MDAKKLRAKALDLLGRRDHSEKELGDKLLQRGGEPDDIATVVKDLRDIGVLDDKRYAETFLACRANKAWGERRYRQELMTRGISKEIIEDTMESEISGEDSTQDSKLQELVRRELAKGRDPQKVIPSMLRRGFSYSEVRQALESCSGVDEFADDIVQH